MLGPSRAFYLLIIFEESQPVNLKLRFYSFSFKEARAFHFKSPSLFSFSKSNKVQDQIPNALIFKNIYPLLMLRQIGAANRNVKHTLLCFRVSFRACLICLKH